MDVFDSREKRGATSQGRHVAFNRVLRCHVMIDSNLPAPIQVQTILPNNDAGHAMLQTLADGDPVGKLEPAGALIRTRRVVDALHSVEAGI